MTLEAFLDDVAAREKTITVYAPEPYEPLEAQFETRNVAIEHEPLPDDGSGGFVVVTEGGEFAGSVGINAVRDLFEVPNGNAIVATDATRALMDLLAETTFVSFDKRRMLGATREIEDRAYRTGTGTLRTGFQRFDALAAQREVYESLAANSSLDVHVYAPRDWSAEVPVAEGLTIHTPHAAEVGAFWFVVFDGGDDPEQACALLAAERDDDPGRFRGFWTYDSEAVADLDAYLSAAYGSPRKR
ncbi:DICT sensory domain-containing protein [Halorussus marinus]|uniref:DICT sensory domain-containing protein n=1 Tax=Halorussus marinus TaxID=2505976 RepID=UPI00106E6B57|nr:DICT sensory domain-containing protein [Halorussus marinus]